MVTNPYDSERDPKKWNVAQLLLSGTTVSWDDLRSVAGGRLSPRTFGFILRDLEAQEATFLTHRDPEFGTLYRFDPEVPYDDRYRISKVTGPDAQRNPPQTPDPEPPGAALSASEPPEASPPPDMPEEPVEEPLDAPEPAQVPDENAPSLVEQLMDEGVAIETIFDIPEEDEGPRSDDDDLPETFVIDPAAYGEGEG